MPKINKVFLFSTYYSSIGALRRKKCVWTSEKVVQSPFVDVTVPNMTIAEYIWKDLHKWSTKTAVVCGVTNRCYTYEQLQKHSLIFGASLRKFFKVRDGDCVAIMLPNVPEFPIAFFGVLTAGGIVTTVNPTYTSYELQRQLELSEAKVIITQSSIISVVKEALNLCRKDVPIIVTEGNIPNKTVSFSELLDNKLIDLSVLKHVARSVDDIAVLPFSSGTTGLPKGVELTNKNLLANCEQQNTECKQYAYTTDLHQDIVLVQLPIFHSYGLCVEMVHKLSVGLKLVTLPQFKPNIFLDTLIDYKINTLYLAPPSVQFLALSPEVTSKHFEHLTCITSGAAPLPLRDIHRLLEKARCDLYFTHGYGMTETSPLISSGPPGFKDFTSVGFPLSNIELRVVNEEFQNLEPNEIGEILVRGPNVMKGYKDNPEANSEALLDGRWFRTGDLGKVNELGALTISGRLKELIKVKGHQVPPAELEDILKEHTKVLDVAVIGVHDADKGEVPKAFIVTEKRVKVEKEELLKFVNKRVAPYKQLADIIFVNEIPRNVGGKILRKQLKEEYF